MDRADVDLQGQRDNAILRARIQDARNDVIQWRDIAKSNEALFYLDEMYECLSVLGGIVEGRLAGVAPNGGEQDWEARISRLLDAYEMIKTVQRYTYGAQLSNLICSFQEDLLNILPEAASPEVSRIGQNIGRFKEECNWTYDELAAKTGIDRKQIIAHVKGRAQPRRRTLKEYAQAFSKELDRLVTPADLKK